MCALSQISLVLHRPIHAASVTRSSRKNPERIRKIFRINNITVFNPYIVDYAETAIKDKKYIK